MDASGRTQEKCEVSLKKQQYFPLLFSAQRSKLARGDDPLQRDLLRILATMHHPELYSIQEARKLLGGISRNTIYQLLRSGELASVVIGCRRFISAAAITELITRSTTSVSPARASTRLCRKRQSALPLPLPPAPRGRGQRTHN
jgi:excisionase family DNA binding protein